ncbi:ATP-dependent DNA helicase [Bifidobacterium bombi]|uniref:DNA 3'-5' helicase n=1 Tax=Bifidobacterium bombi DSM 19703 TaxID=1341695 RepID=A0A080N678_9BIFI|nr:ATP-dependent DNA helicase [Bifidobacterium bombi]KFF31349.1 ATP-dependent DNA helicase, UvrD/REP family [Bifidobacterium bombi DSM 19703]
MDKTDGHSPDGARAMGVGIADERAQYEGGRADVGGSSAPCQPDKASKDKPTVEQAAVIDAALNEDMLVVAGAGSGKTYTMTHRIIELIRRSVPPEKILGLTFTRKAASELLGRVGAAVSDAVSGEPADGGSGRSSASRMFLKPSVFTYDAFFQSIVRRYGLLVGFDQNTQPLSDAGAWQLAVQVVDEHMDEVNPDDFGDFTTLVRQVLALSSAIGSSMIGGGCGSVPEAIKRIRAYDAGLVDALDGFLEGYVDRYLDGQPLPDEDPGEPKPPKRGRKSEEKYELACREYATRMYVHAAFEVRSRREVVRRREVLLNLVEAYGRRKKELNMAEFSDFTVAAYELVSRFPSISRKVRQQYTHVLLDEYQDTSTTQAELIAALFHPQSRDRVHDVDGGLSSVNAVGDPFQSIYAWRGASPGAFRLFIKDFGMPSDYRPHALSVTRRNSRVVLQAANNLTRPLRLEASCEGASSVREVDVSPLRAVENAPEGTLGVLGFQTLGQEIDAVARFAREAIRRYTHDGGSVHDARPHVAVLFRSKNKMPQFAEGLEAHGLSTVMIGYSALLERPDVRDVLALLRAVGDHTDSGSLMRLLATPRFALGAHDLGALASLTNRRNDDCRFQALVEAGLASEDMGHAQRAQVLKEHRDVVPNMVYLPDVLSDPQLRSFLPGDTRFSVRGAEAIARAGDALRAVQANHSLEAQIRSAVEALGLDIDTVVAQAVHEPDKPVSAALAHSAFDTLVSLSQTYCNEIAGDEAPSLRGFVGWLDSLKDVPDDSQLMASEPVDVALMTIHQAKGLEWDAVAVVGLRAGGFPSNQGNGLHIEEKREGSFVDGRWSPGEYAEQADTWLDDPTAVPVPVRADAAILPGHLSGFARNGTEESAGVTRLQGVGVPSRSDEGSAQAGVDDDEIFHDVAGLRLPDKQREDDDRPTPREEYGRRLHADERRLMYVALTRARYDALLTYSKGNDLTRIPDNGGMTRKVGKPSDFWNEACRSMQGPGALDVGQVVGMATAEAGDSSEQEGASASKGHGGHTLMDLGSPAPEGIFVGEAAESYCDAVVVQAWSEPVDDDEASRDLVWPSDMSPALASRLRWSADRVRDVRGGLQSRKDSTAAHIECSGDGSYADSDAGCAPAIMETSRSAGPVADDSLFVRAQALLDDPDLMPWNAFDREAPEDGGTDDAPSVSGYRPREVGDGLLDADVRRRGERLLSKRRQNVTDIQARTGHLDEAQSRRYWRALVRPIPVVSSPAAQAGTRLHSWAERFVKAYYGPESALTDQGLGADTQGGALMLSGVGETREDMLAELDADMSRMESGATDMDCGQALQESHVLTWERRLARSRWSRRRPFAAEMQIVASVAQLGGEIINGKLDAVFYGGIDDKEGDDRVDDGRYTIVDWKTGRKPVAKDEVERKLAQLDMYRLLFSVSESVPLERIDATLYYLNESDESGREIHASHKTGEEIVAQLREGVDESFDDDG